MTNGISIAITTLFMAVNIAIIVKLLFIDIKKHARDGLTLYLLYASLALLCWQVIYTAYFITSRISLMRFLYDFRLPFAALTLLFMLLIILRFYRLEHFITKISLTIMLIVPVFTFIYSLLSPYNDFIRRSFSVLSTSPMHKVLSENGIWFWIHATSCFSFLLITFCVGIYCHHKLPRSYRASSFAILISPVLVMTAASLQLSGLSYPYYELPIIGTSIAVTIIYLSAINSKGMDFISSARNIIYDYLNEGIFVLNDERYIVYLNKNAGKLVKDLGLSVLNQQYDNVFERAVEFTSHIEAAPADEDGLDMTFIKDGVESVFNLREKPIKDRSGMPIGTFAVLDDVTENRAIINKLENIGGIDALTGLPNRRSIEKFIKSVDNGSKLPIGIISADVNGLKTVNDVLGHKQGDVLIRLISDILSDACPSRGRVSRIGGDEFLMVLPNSDEETMIYLIAEINERLASCQNYMFRPSVSFGFDIKYKKEQNLDTVIQRADEKMYENKRIMKAQRKE